VSRDGPHGVQAFSGRTDVTDRPRVPVASDNVALVITGEIRGKAGRVWDASWGLVFVKGPAEVLAADKVTAGRPDAVRG
jgi:hypothetical protein